MAKLSLMWGLLSFCLGTFVGIFVVSFVAGSGRIDSWGDYLGVFIIAVAFERFIKLPPWH